ncbi:uncharacterized protein JN550_003831 [Neoarthrinium moseri]|uniref:uncharacterized protein n=1 Tax=Neoarthrinium moseri TaxID=1658444 RepID=UPI001FDE05CA|nr:uncharacterized protein JN550_003831 [Neoarthrinium moseri]KAI1872957.1 hypothetical protein JN550_003831 [Neoarthrinium moseri]
MFPRNFLVLALSISLTLAAPELEHPSGTMKARPYIASKASVSDNICYVRGKAHRAPTFQAPTRDVCYPIKATNQLKIYKTATCTNGTAALLARYDAPNCVGEPNMLDIVDEELLERCLKMPSDAAGSYAFWCTGDITKPLVKALSNTPDKSETSNGSILGLIGMLLLVLAVVTLFALIRLAIFLHRCITTGNKFMGLFQKDGSIAL